MRRVMLFDRYDQPIGELSPREVMALTRHEEVNGAHTLTIRTTRVLEQGWRILTQDGSGKWREHVVYGTDASHTGGDTVGEYYCVWSITPDLAGTTVSAMPGVQTPTTAALALDAALEGTDRWVRGTVTQTSSGGASMYDMSGWEAISVLLDVWGGELDTTIEVGATGVTARKVDLYELQGSSEAVRRYDFGADLRSVRRRVADGPLYCRISPRGKGKETEGGGYGRKIRINDDDPTQPDWLEYAPMVDAAKLPDGSGGWEYPTLIVENSDIDDPDVLRTWGESVKEGFCTPTVTYDIDVVQAFAEGVDMQSVALGDVVHLVDRKFGDGIRMSGRISSMTVDMLNERNVEVTIGSASQWLADTLAAMDARFEAVHSALTEVVAHNNYMATAAYIDSLLSRINAEVNATGGYVYITQGQGIRTYDTAVSDPLVGAEASAVVEIKGGTIRIANTRTQGAWDWKTVFTSGHIAANLVTAANIITGYIGSAGGTFIDLDNNTVQLGDSDMSHVIIDQDSFDMYDGDLSMGHFGGTAQTISGTTYSGIYWTLGTRTSTNQGLYSLTAGVDNYAGRSSPGSATFGRGLYAAGTAQPPNGYTGIVVGGYNVKSGGNYDVAGSELLTTSNAPSLLLVLGNGSGDSNRSNALEVDKFGNLGLKGQIVSKNGIGKYLSTSLISKSSVDITAVELCTLELPTIETQTVVGSIWLIEADLGGTSGTGSHLKEFKLQRTYDTGSSPYWYDLKTVSFYGGRGELTYIYSRDNTDSRRYTKLRITGSYQIPGQSGATGNVQARIRAVRIV